MSAVRPEAAAAAEWWAEQLRNPPVHSNGDADDDELDSAWLIGLVGNHLREQQSEETIEAFRLHLGEEIERHLQRYGGSWDPAHPGTGSMLRCVDVEYSPHETLTAAAAAAGFRLGSFDLPIKTVMWIDPGLVRVRSGARAEIVTWWEWVE